MSGPVPLELQSKISAWRLKAAEGTVTLEEMREGIIYLRAGRMQASVAAQATKRTAAKKAVAPPADDMLSELDGL